MFRSADTEVSKTALLTLGQLPECLDLARALTAVGWRVVIAEPFGWHLAGLSRAVAKSVKVTPPSHDPEAYRRDLLEVIAREGVSLVLPVSVETLHVAALSEVLPETVRLFTSAQPRLLALHDKQSFIERAAALGLAVPESAPLGTPRALEIAKAGPHVVKPRSTSAGRGVVFREAGAALPGAGDDLVVQQRLPGATLSSFSIVRQGQPLLTLVYRGRDYDGAVAINLERIEQPEVVAWAERFIAESGHHGFIGFDFVLDAEGRPCAVECNPRATSGLHFLETESLGHCLADPEMHQPPSFRAARHLQLFYSCLTAAQAAVFRRDDPLGKLQRLITTPDVTWRWRDPLPFLLMTPASAQIISKAILSRKTLGQAAVEDIDWTAAPADVETDAASVAQF